MSIQVRNVCKSFRNAPERLTALADVSFDVAEGEFVSIVGPSGCGKTTLLRILAGLIQPDSGSVAFDNMPARTAMVFQEHGLFPWMRVLDNVTFGLRMQHVERSQREDRAANVLRQMGLHAFRARYPHELSVGMQQRVGIARALISDAPVMLMDEPFGALDASTKLLMQQDLLLDWKSRNRSVVYVTHDIDEAIVMGDRVLVMSGRPGRIRATLDIALPRPRDLFNRDDPTVVRTRWLIWDMLKDEVRRNLARPT
jgi:NitT/TauT family transport system ATP-binding protein